MITLAVRNYRHEKKFFHEDDFSSLPNLILVLNEVITGESDLTLEGKRFLEERYGYNDLAKKIVQNGGLLELTDGQNIEAVESALEKIQPMENRDFMNND